MEVEKQTNFESLINDYFQTLNELNEQRRIELIQKVWAVDGIFVSPIGKAQGYKEINDLIGGFHQHSPGTTVYQTEEIESLYANFLCFGFEIVASDGTMLSKGRDFAIIKNDKLQLVAGFFDSTAKNTKESTSQENIEAVKQVYKAFSAGEIRTVIKFFAPTIEWFAADNSPIADNSPYRGFDAIRDEVFPRLGTLFPGMQIDIQEILAMENKVVMLGYYRNIPRKAGGTTDAQVAHILTFQSGKIIKFQQYLDTYKFSKL